jgi:hypothetical protein
MSVFFLQFFSQVAIKWQFCFAFALYKQIFEPNPVSPMMKHCGTLAAY